MSEQLTVLSTAIAEYAADRGVSNIKALPGARWVHAVDDHWIIAVNANDSPIMAEPAGTMGAELPPFHFAVWFNGWLAGIFSPFAGQFAAGEAANEDTFLAALKVAKIEAAR